MKGVEIERKFLLLPIKVECFLRIHKLDYEILDMEQFYIERDGKIGRIRRVNDKYFLTLKKGEGMVREEHESEIEQSVFRNILSKDKPVGALKKFRYKVMLGGYKYEVDEYLDDLYGLVMLEVEFDTEEEANQFKVSDVFKKIVLKEVTGENEFLNETIGIMNLNRKISCEDVYV